MKKISYFYLLLKYRIFDKTNSAFLNATVQLGAK